MDPLGVENAQPRDAGHMKQATHGGRTRNKHTVAPHEIYYEVIDKTFSPVPVAPTPPIPQTLHVGGAETGAYTAAQ